jgi:PDZ domain-containing protein
VALTVLAVLAVVVASLVHLPYAVLMPGPATDVLGVQRGTDGKSAPLISVSGAPTYPTSGTLKFTTVSVRGGPGYPVTALDLVQAWLDPTEEVLPVDQVFPAEATQQQVADENKAEMVSSQQEAVVVALRAMGTTVPESVQVGQLAKDAPATGQLQVGDVIQSVGGAPATDPVAVRAAVRKIAPGQTIEVVVQRAGATVTAHPATGRAEDGRTILGIVLQRHFDFPFTVTIDAGNVGGPSAGLMFSLGVFDVLTDGALAGGASIAGTGTLDDTGTVGPIGGIAQKMVGAQRSGATFFLAPSENCADVLGHVPDGLTVVKVSTFADARDAVAEIGRGQTAALPHC